jgi:hypothetical protein
MQQARRGTNHPQIKESKIITPEVSNVAPCCELNPVNLVGFLC